MHLPNQLVSGIRNTKYRKAKGFTLIELLIVITIIAILIGAGSYSWQNAQIKGRDSKRKSDISAIQQALELYFQSNGRYPPLADTGNWCTQISNATIPDVKNALEPNYISKIPQDPTMMGTSKDYFYKKDSHTTYRLLSTLENTKDPNYLASGDMLTCSSYTPADYHYKVINP